MEDWSSRTGEDKKEKEERNSAVKTKRYSKIVKLRSLFLLAGLALCIIQLAMIRFILKWLWPEIRPWHYVLLFILLCVLVVLAHWFQCIMRNRSHRAFINKVGRVAKDFANSHNLMLETSEYSGSVSFYFKHPQGGRGVVTLQQWYREKPMFSTEWLCGNYDTCTVGRKGEIKELAGIEEEYLRGVLIETLRKVLSWREEDLIVEKSSWNWKETISKEDFERRYDKYPIPKLLSE